MADIQFYKNDIMICYFDLLSLTWKHHRWLLKDFGIHWTEFGIEM